MSEFNALGFIQKVENIFGTDLFCRRRGLNHRRNATSVLRHIHICVLCFKISSGVYGECILKPPPAAELPA